MGEVVVLGMMGWAISTLCEVVWRLVRSTGRALLALQPFRLIRNDYLDHLLETEATLAVVIAQVDVHRGQAAPAPTQVKSQ